MFRGVGFLPFFLFLYTYTDFISVYKCHPHRPGIYDVIDPPWQPLLSRMPNGFFHFIPLYHFFTLLSELLSQSPLLALIRHTSPATFLGYFFLDSSVLPTSLTGKFRPPFATFILSYVHSFLAFNLPFFFLFFLLSQTGPFCYTQATSPSPQYPST